jgi:hypothetical protein
MITIISGGQTGVDATALRVAKNCNIPTGGLMPKGYMTEDGPQPSYAELYQVKESEFEGYGHRTEVNVRNSNITLIFNAGEVGDGTRLTMRECVKRSKNYKLFDVDVSDDEVPELVEEIVNYVKASREYRAKNCVINVAGTRGSKLGAENEERLERILTEGFQGL